MCEDNGIILIPIVRWNKIEVNGTGVLDSDLGKKNTHTKTKTKKWVSHIPVIGYKAGLKKEGNGLDCFYPYVAK